MRTKTLVGCAAVAAYAATVLLANYFIGHVGLQFGGHGPHVIPVGFGLYAPSGVLWVAAALALRNLVQETLGRRVAAAGIAAARGIPQVAVGVHGGDHAIYPDCRPEFIAAMDSALRLGTDGAVGLYAPFLTWNKAQIAARAADVGVPIAQTWSCYEGGAMHCGRCGTCVERREALALAGVPDPTEYQQEVPA